nr:MULTISPECIES: glycine zipper 2TM domain-containing protein [Shewanella]
MSVMTPAQAKYDRNTAQQVEKVTFGTVESVKHVTEQQLIEDQNQGWRTFGGALIGGLIGNQFGGGHGRNVATVLGAIAGGAMARQYHQSPQYIEYKIIELMIKNDDGTQVMVIQDEDPSMAFNAGDDVRVVYLKGYVRVDLAM